MDEDLYHSQVNDWDTFEVEVMDYHHSSEYHNLNQMEIEEVELDHNDVTNSHIVEHLFPKSFQGGQDTDVFGSEGMTYMILVTGTTILVFLTTMWIVYYSAPKRKRNDKSKQFLDKTELLRPLDALEVLKELPPAIPSSVHTDKIIQFRLAQLSHSLFHYACGEYTQLEAILTDYASISGSLSMDPVESVTAQINALITMLDRTSYAYQRAQYSQHNSYLHGYFHRNQHVEDRIEHHYQRAALMGIIIELAFVKDALREGAVLSNRQHLNKAVARLRTAIFDSDVYTMLECLELLDSESRYRNDCKAAEDKIAEIYEEEDRQAREEEKKILNKHIEEMVETFETLSFSNTPMDGANMSSSFKRPLPICAPVASNTENTNITASTNAAATAPEPSAPYPDLNPQNNPNPNSNTDAFATTVPVEANDRDIDDSSTAFVNNNDFMLGGLSTRSAPQLHPTQTQEQSQCHSLLGGIAIPYNVSAKSTGGMYHTDSSDCLSPLSPQASAAHLINSQWKMEALKMKRESHDRVERRLQELKDKRNDTKERARRNARRLSDNRDRDVRKAKLFLDGIEEQQKARMQGEEDARLREEKELWTLFRSEKDTQHRTDQRVFFVWALIITIAFLFVHSGLLDRNVAGAGGAMWWSLTVIRRSCEYLACDGTPVAVYSNKASSSTSTPTLAQISSLQLALPMPDEVQARQLNETAVYVLHSYQSTYRNTALHAQEFVSESVIKPVRSYALKYTMGSYMTHIFQSINMLPSTSTRNNASVFSEIVAAGRCLFHLLARSVPSIAVSKLFRALGMKRVAEWVQASLSVICFADVFLQMALGPMLPLLLLGIAHIGVYTLLSCYTADILRWQIYGIDVRWFVLYVLYPLVILFSIVRFGS